MTTALATKNDAPAWSEEQVALVKRTVAKDATNDELKMFLHLSGKYNLDPFAKEIWFLKMGGQPTITTSRDGYLKIANEHPAFSGLVSDVVYAKDSFAKTPDGVSHTYGVGDRGPIIGAYALVYRSDRRFPVYVFAPMKDYQKPSGTWKTYPHAMILKVAEAMALKRAFSLSGLVTVEELGTPDQKSEDVVTVDAVSATPVTAKSIREEPEFAVDWSAVKELTEQLGWTKLEVAAFAKERLGLPLKEMLQSSVDELADLMREELRKRTEAEA